MGKAVLEYDDLLSVEIQGKAHGLGGCFFQGEPLGFLYVFGFGVYRRLTGIEGFLPVLTDVMTVVLTDPAVSAVCSQR